MGGAINTQTQIQVDRFVATAQAAQPPRVEKRDATPDNASAFMEWMAAAGYDPAHLAAMGPAELESMYTASPDEFDADEAQVQAQLVVLGYAPGPIDGWYGPQTSEAVAQFQRDHGIEPADGTMTPETLEAMQAAATGDTGGATGSEPSPGTAEYTDRTIGAAITAVDSASPTSPNASDHMLEGINATVDDAVEADYTRLVEAEGMTPQQAREALANRYNDGTRSDQVMEAALARLEQDGRIEASPAGEPETEATDATDAPGSDYGSLPQETRDLVGDVVAAQTASDEALRSQGDNGPTVDARARELHEARAALAESLGIGDLTPEIEQALDEVVAAQRAFDEAVAREGDNGPTVDGLARDLHAAQDLLAGLIA